MKTEARIILAGSSFLLAVGLAGFLFWAGVIKLNTPWAARYPVRGVDVSEYQGQIDWKAIEGQGMRFAFVKATEGSGYTDPRFHANWQAAGSTSMVLGAYHFFSFDSPAQTQAENFISAVEPRGGMLPPVIDIELYGKYKGNPPDPEAVRAQLDVMLGALKAHYGAKPILYATQKAYALYIRGHYSEYPLWIRDVYFVPSSKVDWTFWQYTDKGRLDGYDGKERHIDINVFAGDAGELRQLTVE